MRPTLMTLAAAAALSGCSFMTPTRIAPPAPAPVAAADPAVSARLMADVTLLASDTLQGRDTGAIGGAAARAYIVERLDALGVSAPPVGRLQSFTAPGRTREGSRAFNGVNVVGLIPGTRVGDRYIVVTAHYDHVGINGGQIYNGADDNASGVASMLELARRLKADPPEHGVLIVALDGEERGLLGAKHFVNEPPVPLTSIAMNLNLDMTARAETDGKLWVTGTYQHPSLRPMLEPLPAIGRVSLAFGKDTPQDLGEDNWVEASDHAAFHAAKLPFLYLGVDYHSDYHQPTDDAERITPAVFSDSTEMVIAAFRALDRSLDR